MSTTERSIEQRLDRLEAQLDRITGLLEQSLDHVAMGVDAADEWVRDQKAAGVDVDANLRALARAAPRLTAPETVEALTRIAALAPRLESVAALAAGFDDHVAMAADAADEWVREHDRRGVSVDERWRAGVMALDRVTDPVVLDRLSRLAGSVEQFESLILLASHFDDYAAMAVDVADAWVRERTAEGWDPATGIESAASLLQRLTEPELLGSIRVLVEQAPAVATSLKALDASARARGTTLPAFFAELTTTADVVLELVQSGALRRLTDMGRAAATALAEPSAPVGLFGTLGALGDPQVQRVVGAGVHVARRVGATLDASSSSRITKE